MIWFRLALALGMSVARAQEEIDSREFSEWLAFGRIEPFGEWRQDQRAGKICAALTNPWLKKGDRERGPVDFFPELREMLAPPEEADGAPQTMGCGLQAKLIAAFKRAGIKVRRKGEADGDDRPD